MQFETYLVKRMSLPKRTVCAFWAATFIGRCWDFWSVAAAAGGVFVVFVRVAPRSVCKSVLTPKYTQYIDIYIQIYTCMYYPPPPFFLHKFTHVREPSGNISLSFRLVWFLGFLFFWFRFSDSSQSLLYIVFVFSRHALNELQFCNNWIF